MTRKQLISSCFIALLVFVLFQFYLILSPFLEAILWSSLLCFGFYPLYDRLHRKLPKQPNLSAMLMTLIVFLIVFPPIVILLVNLTGEAVDLYQRASDYVRAGKLEELINQIHNLPWIQKIEVNVLRWEPLKEKASEWLLGSSKALANYSVSQVGKITTNTIFIVLNIFVTFFMMFFFFKDGRLIYEFIYKIVPLEESNKKAIFDPITGTLEAVIRGQMLTSLVQSAVLGLVLWSLQIPGAILFGIATFFTSLIPVLGTWIVWLPITGYLFFVEHNLTKGIILLCFGLGISTIDNVIKPIFIGERTKLPYFLLFFGIMGGLKVYGIKGIVLAPVVLSLFFALVKIYQEKFLHGPSDPTA